MTRHLSQGFAATYLFSAADRAGARVFLIVCTALLHSALPVLAQDATPQSPPAHVSFVEGTAVLERDGRTDTSPTSMPVLAGDRVRTQAGRVEILYADGSALHLDQQSVVDFQSDEIVRLLDGRMRLNIAGRQEVSYRVDAPAAWVEIAEPGEYRIALLGAEREAQVELAVLRGAAELVNEEGRSLVRAGERAFARAGAQPSPPYVFNSAAWDEFDRWSESRRDTRLGLSAQYLPPDVRPYSTTFDNYGSWQYETTYGYVWYPRVAVGWRPYYHGRWASLRPYGWTWIAADPWGWPTHHYGRWGFSGSWFWIPGRHWGSAWVSWAYAPNYVSWCPLGWNNRPVFSFVNVNLNYHHGRYYDPWHAWTAVPRRHFGVGYVNTNVVAGRRLDGRAFVVRDSAPDWRSTAAGAPAPIRTAGRADYAVPRGTANSAFSSPAGRSPSSSPSRSFPAPAREPRVPPTGSVGSARSSVAPVTTAPQRAVPRDRGVRADNLAPSASRSERDASAGTRRVFDTRGMGGRRSNDQPSATPEPSIRAVPRTTQDVSPDRPASSEWGRTDRSISRPPARSMPESRAYAPPEAGYRRAPESPQTVDTGSPGNQYRAIPRQDSPRPSYEAPRPSPRSYGTPSPESRPPSYGGGAERRGGASGSPSTGAPARGDSSSDSGQSRSRGAQPSRGQARSRG
jgi:uncharacterized protein DUF6600/FecR-like protein